MINMASSNINLNMNNNKVFTDNNFGFYHFADHFLVECPTCKNMADVVPKKNSQHTTTRTWTLICSNCGYFNTALPSNSLTLFHGKDWYFLQPLWLQIPSCGNTLWAFNLEHLQYIKEYVRADIRKKLKHIKYGWINKSLISRLPKWIKTKKNREDILKAITLLEIKCKKRNT